MVGALACGVGCAARNPEFVEADARVDVVGASDASLDRTESETSPSFDGRPPDAPTAPHPRLVGYWRFDEGPGTTAVDSSGNDNHGTLESLDPASARVPGRQGSALEFGAGASGAAGVRVPLTSSITGIRQFTMAAWIWRSGSFPTQNTAVLSRQLGTTSREIYGLSTLGNDLVIYAGTDATPAPEVRGSGAAPVGVWLHATATFDGTTLRLYRDGQQIGSYPLTRALPQDPSTPLYIGTNKNPARNDVFLGRIDEVALYNVALPAQSVAALAGGASPVGF
jgi:Concanavalin A-like lectin/glucanases superfamily